MKEFKPFKPLNIPVLFLIFNRLDTAKEVFEAIKKAKPPRLYIASDGPRENKEGEERIVKEVRKYVLDNIDWDCEVKTLFREKNLGCKMAVSGAITWFFENEEQGIILEDDCLPSQSFFWYCEELLEKYKNDMRVWHISGYKYPYLPSDDFSYNFSEFTMVWGWATWKSRWQYYDSQINLFKESPFLLEDYKFFSWDFVNKERKKILYLLLENKIDTWDYQWNFVVRINNGLSIRPRRNLVRNIGFGMGTHTTYFNKILAENYEREMELPLTHPPIIMVYKKADEIFAKRNFSKIEKIKKKLRLSK